MMKRYFTAISLFFVICVLYPDISFAEYSQAQLRIVDNLTAEFEKSGKNSAKPTAEYIKKRFSNSTDKDFTAYSDMLFKGMNSFGYTEKSTNCTQKMTENTSWNKAISTSVRAIHHSQSPRSDSAQNGNGTDCKKYGKSSECKKAGENKQ